MEDNKWLKNLKKSLSNYMISNQYSFSKWEFDFEKKASEKNVIEKIKNILKKVDPNFTTKDEFTQFTNIYVNLEMWGITSERVGGKPKQFNFMSLYADATHAYHPSKCDYLVSGDTGMLIKAFLTYKVFDIKTEVLSIIDFKNKFNTLKRNESSLLSHLELTNYYIKKGFVIRDKPNARLIKLDQPIINYFNRLQVSENGYLLFKTTHYVGFMFREIQLINKKLINLIGLDDFGKGDYKENEFKDFEMDVMIRTWTLLGSEFRIFVGSASNGEAKICLQFIFQ